MALAKIDVVNAAVLLVGGAKIDSLTDNTKAARVASSMYEIARNEIFDLPIDFRFATTRAQLSHHSTDPIHGNYDHQCVLPAGCRRVIAQVDASDDETEYDFERELLVVTSGTTESEYDVILTNEDLVYIKYIRLREDVSKWPAWFTKLVYINLALLICEPLKQDKQKKNQILLMAEEAYKKAEQANSLENVRVDSDNRKLDKGNTQVVDAAQDSEADKRYIVSRS